LVDFPQGCVSNKISSFLVASSVLILSEKANNL